MTHATFKQKLDAAGNIPGIYNYCNRFCEDCIFTEVCATFKMFSIRTSGTENPDDIFKVLEESIGETSLFMKEFMDEHGIDPEDITEDPADVAWREKIDEAVNHHRLVAKSKDYYTMLTSFFRALDRDDSNSIVTGQVGLSELEIQKLMSLCFHIQTKMNRALHGFYEMDPFGEDDFDMFDMNGSAKCLLVMMDDSFEIWKKMLNLNPQSDIQVTQITTLLKSLRKETEIQFPDARAFIRGGFDEI